jgi:SAM-dependent methyltransferase
MTDRETIAVYDARAAEYAEVTSGIAADPRLIDFIARLPAQSRVLDLGCGPGAAAAEMARAGHDALAWDASDGMVALAAAQPGVRAEQRLFGDLASLAPGSLQGVWANFSLLHAPRAEMPDHLAAIARALVPGGVFLVALKTGAGDIRDSIGRLYSYYTEAELRTLLDAAGFTVDRVDTGRDPGLSGEISDWISLTCLR